MLKQKRQFFEILYVIADLIVISIAWIFAFWLRFHSGWVPVYYGLPSFTEYLFMMVYIWVIWATVYKRTGLYKPMRGVRRTKEILLLINANLVAVLILIALTFLLKEKEIAFSRLVFIYFGVAATIFSIAERLFLRFFLREVRRKGYNLRYMLIVGAGQVAADIASRVRLHRELGIQLIGCISKTGTEEKGPWGMPVLGSYYDLDRLLEEKAIDQIVIALPLEDHYLLTEILERTGDSLVDIKIIPDIYRFVSVGGSIEEFEGLPVINIQDSPLNGINLQAKRFFDLVSSFIGLLILSPLFLLIAIIVKYSSRGPVFYKQERASLDGKTFNIYKFRTMTFDAEQEGPGWTTKNDCRVTWIGKILRSTSLDEFPQLFNVFRGDMSLVGPRPERPVYISDFRHKIPNYMLRHKVPAGITGWAQVNGWRGNTSIDKRIEFDLYYITNWSLFFDIKILLMTFFKGLINKNAY